MKRIAYQEIIGLMDKNPSEHQRMISAGRLTHRNTVLELPDDFQLPDGIENGKGMRGLGDLVAKVAQPVARMIDGVMGTDLKNCPACGDRKDKLNKAVPIEPLRRLAKVIAGRKEEKP